MIDLAARFSRHQYEGGIWLVVIAAIFSRETVELVSMYEIVFRGRMVSDIVPKVTHWCSIHDAGAVGYGFPEESFVKRVVR